jgi:topoisomerase-4 subunit A
MEEVQNHLDHLIDFAIEYFRQIKKKYGKGRERRTELRNFDTIEAVKVAIANEKLYVNRVEGFAGTGLKKDEFVCECSDIDDIIAFREDGTFIVTKVADKVFIGQNIIHIGVYMKNDSRTVYNMIYRDGKNGKIMVKRFSVLGITRDKEYIMTKGAPGSKVLYFTANPNGEAEVIRIELKPKPRLKKTSFDFNFAELAIKGRNSIGNTLTKYAVRKIEQRQEGVSTLGSLNIWYDETVQRLNTDGRGTLLGAFSGTDRIITLMQSGNYRLSSFDLTTHFDEDMIRIEKYEPERVYSVVYLEHKTKSYYLKRFKAEPTDKKVSFTEEPDKMILITDALNPEVEILFDMKLKSKGAEKERVAVKDFIGIKSFKAKGKRLTSHPVKKVSWIEPEEGETVEPLANVTDESPGMPGKKKQEPEITMTGKGSPENGKRKNKKYAEPQGPKVKIIGSEIIPPDEAGSEPGETDELQLELPL